MVAENLISTLSHNLCADYENITLGDVPCLNLTNGTAPGAGTRAPIQQFDSVKFQDREFRTSNISSNNRHNMRNDKDNDNDNEREEKDKSKENGNLNRNETLEESSLDSFCDVVVSFRCKFCTFLADDKAVVKLHVNQLHSFKLPPEPTLPQRQPQLETNPEDKTEIETKAELRKTLPDLNVLNSSTKLPLPSVPLLQIPHFLLDKEEYRNQIHKKNEVKFREDEDIDNNNDHSMKGSENDRDEVFFCSKCSIIFSSALLCCNHMVEVHQLREFSTDLIRENPLNSNPQPCPPKRKRIRCSKQSQPRPTPIALDSQSSRPSKRCKLFPNGSSNGSGSSSSNGNTISNSNSNGVGHMCKLCKTKFRTIVAMQTHEKCHISVPEGSQITSTVKKSKSYKSYVVKGYTCCYCDGDKILGGNCRVTSAVGSSSGSSSCAGSGPGPGAHSSHNGSSGPGSGSGALTVTKFLTWAKCASHLWKDHEVDCDLYTCSACKYKTPTLAKLKDHELVHTSEAKFTCSTCRKSFKQLKQLKNHEKYHKTNNTKLPPPSEARWYTPKECPVCTRILSDSKCLKKHISAVHNKMKPYVCNICGHTSARKAELQLHIRQHTGEKPYKCPACPFSTGDHNSLRKHKQRHAENRPYGCPYCDYSAIQSHAFKKHVLAVHPGQEIVFVCGSCGLACVNEASFDAHRKDHEEGRLPVETTTTRNDGQNGRNRNSSHGKSNNVSNSDESTRASTEEAESNDGKTLVSSNFWLRDEDSMEVVDTGGITIPAPTLSTVSGPSSSSGSGSDSLDNDKEENENSQERTNGVLPTAESPGQQDARKYSRSIMALHGPVQSQSENGGHHEDEYGEMNGHASSSSTLSNGINIKDSERLLKNVLTNTNTSPRKCFAELLTRHEHDNDNASGPTPTSASGSSSAPTPSQAPASNLATTNFGLGLNGVDESRAISIVTELLSDSDCNTLHQFLNFDPVLCSSDSIDLPDLLCNDHSNDGTLEKLLNMNVTGFS